MSAMCVPSLMAQSDQFALTVIASPATGGVVSTSEGLPTTDTGQLVMINATPARGYEFVYWLGGVTDPTSSTTTVLLDASKTIIAIFERIEAENSLGAATGGFSGGRKSASRSSTSNFNQRIPGPQNLHMGSPSSQGNKYTPYEIPLNPEVPEPATILMLATGAIMLLRKRSKGNLPKSFCGHLADSASPLNNLTHNSVVISEVT